MKTQSVSSLIALASTIQVAAATGFGKGGFFSCPSNTNNECVPQQNTGFDWATLNPGKPVTNYGGMNFNGWGCANSFGKRDPLAKRTFANTKCITGSAHSDKSKSSSFSCGANTEVKKFSVTEMHVSVEFDCDLDFHFEMPDKSLCKQTSGCSSGGSIIKNTQCGGATAVTIVYPPNKGKNKGKGKDKCDLGIHSIGFDCKPPVGTSTRSTTSKPPPTSTKPTTTPSTIPASQTKPSTSPAETTTAASSGASSSSSIVTTSSVASTPADSTIPAPSGSRTSSFGNSSTIATPSSTGFTTLVSSNSAESSTDVVSTTATSPGETTPAVPTPSVTLPAESSVVITTQVVVTTLTTCPFTSTHTTAGTTSIETGTTVSTITVSSTVTSTVCTRCTAAPTSLPGVPTDVPTSLPGVPTSLPGDNSPASTTSAEGPAPTAPGVPETLPKCMNTWNFLVGCADNTDHTCYCPSTEFVNNVFQCLSAYGADDKDISEAAAYFQGICAPYIPQNPAIVTACPGGPPAAVTPAPGVPGITVAPAANIPVTTISIQTTITVPCVESTGVSSGLVIPSSSTTTAISTIITVPQVVFSTPTGAPAGTATAAVPLLVVGTPAAVPAETTPVSGNSGASATTIATVPVAATSARNGTSAPLIANSGSSTGVAFGSIIGAALLAIFAL